MKEERNYARFFSLLEKLPGADKETLVAQYTNGRTVRLHETTDREYNTMCDDMDRLVGFGQHMEALRSELKRKRSVCLKLMQQLGIDTTDWVRVDSFCLHPRIVGKPFRKISLEELEALSVKLRTIMRKGGVKMLSAQPECTGPRGCTSVVIHGNGKKIES
ncbi:MAG: hypothetical protein PUG76_09535 [Prevotellaceae bacterium]|nr:hypothetical protein [Prevotellaceae bacterium]